MSDSVVITTPIPTPEEMADSLGVSRSRLKWLKSILRGQGSLPQQKRGSKKPEKKQKSSSIGSYVTARTKTRSKSSR